MRTQEKIKAFIQKRAGNGVTSSEKFKSQHKRTDHTRTNGAVGG
jgi:hypothetical protein